MHISILFDTAGTVRIGRREGDITTEWLAADDSHGKHLDGVVVCCAFNDDETLDTVFDGVRLSLSRYNIEEGEAVYHTDVDGLLSWQDARKLHAFLGLLLSTQAA